MSWQLQDAKNRLSEVVRRAKTQGPQVITVRGKEEVAVISIEELRALKRARQPAGSRWWETAPCLDGLDLERSRDTGRDVDLG